MARWKRADSSRDAVPPEAAEATSEASCRELASSTVPSVIASTTGVPPVSGPPSQIVVPSRCTLLHAYCRPWMSWDRSSSSVASAASSSSESRRTPSDAPVSLSRPATATCDPSHDRMSAALRPVSARTPSSAESSRPSIPSLDAEAGNRRSKRVRLSFCPADGSRYAVAKKSTSAGVVVESCSPLPLSAYMTAPSPTPPSTSTAASTPPRTMRVRRPRLEVGRRGEPRSAGAVGADGAGGSGSRAPSEPDSASLGMSFMAASSSGSSRRGPERARMDPTDPLSIGVPEEGMNPVPEGRSTPRAARAGACRPPGDRAVDRRPGPDRREPPSFRPRPSRRGASGPRRSTCGWRWCRPAA